LVIDAGAWLRTEQGGLIQLVAVGWLGSEVGYFRDRRVRSLGVVFRWSP
jgi:hypothetical protein